MDRVAFRPLVVPVRTAEGTVFVPTIRVRRFGSTDLVFSLPQVSGNGRLAFTTARRSAAWCTGHADQAVARLRAKAI